MGRNKRASSGNDEALSNHALVDSFDGIEDAHLIDIRWIVSPREDIPDHQERSRDGQGRQRTPTLWGTSQIRCLEHFKFLLMTWVSLTTGFPFTAEILHGRLLFKGGLLHDGILCTLTPIEALVAPGLTEISHTPGFQSGIWQRSFCLIYSILRGYMYT